MTTLIVLLIVMAFSAFFSGMEIAYVSVEKMRLQVNRSQLWTAPVVDFFLRHPSGFISTMLVGNNIALVIYGIVTAQLIDAYILTDPAMNAFLRLFLETLMSTVVIIFVGEFIPKTLFRINPNLTLSVLAPVLLPIYIILLPISLLCRSLSGAILRLFGLRLSKDNSQRAFSRVDLDEYVSSSIDNALDAPLLGSEVTIFRNALDFSSTRVRDCMVPRTEMVTVSLDEDLDRLIDVFTGSGLTKVPVHDGGVDNIVGYVHSLEMFRHKEDWRRHILPLRVVPESMPADRLMRLFMQDKRSLALVVDEFGGTSGLVSLEDLVEEIFGDINDEHDILHEQIRRISDDEYEISALMEIDQVNEQLHADLPLSEEYQTISGLILSLSGGLPQCGEEFHAGHASLTVASVLANRIERVSLRLVPRS